MPRAPLGRRPIRDPRITYVSPPRRRQKAIDPPVQNTVKCVCDRYPETCKAHV